MNNQAAQTMPVSEEFTLRAMAKNYGDGPHRWDKLDREVCERAADEIKALHERVAALSQPAGVPEGYVLIPARMELTPENMAALAFMLGGDPDAKDADERWNGGTLWVGETIGDNGEKYYGLNVANVECYEEGSMPIVEFAAAPAASGGEVDHG